ncbi:MAG: hypothetical protein JXX14_02645 [Deltaproteobacteria bacterium]|nr:hypothetical protein [Deltaproteobacteria bacterium]
MSKVRQRKNDLLVNILMSHAGLLWIGAVLPILACNRVASVSGGATDSDFRPMLTTDSGTTAAPDTALDSATGDTALDTATFWDTVTANDALIFNVDTTPREAAVFEPRTMSMPYQYVQTGEMRLFDTAHLRGGLQINATSAGNIVLSGFTANPWPTPTDTASEPVFVPFTLELNPLGQTVHLWTFPGVSSPLVTWVDENDRMVWIGSPARVATIGDQSVTSEESIFYYARIDLATGSADELALIPATPNFAPLKNPFTVRTVTGDAAGNIYVGGAAGLSNERASMVKIDSAGNLLWEVSWISCENTAYFRDMAAVGLGAIATVGVFNCGLVVGEEELRTEYPTGKRYLEDGFMAWLSTADGTTLHTKQAGGLEWEGLTTLNRTADGALRAGGYFSDDVQIDHMRIPGRGDYAVMMIEIASNGSVTWATALRDGLHLNRALVDALNRSHLVGWARPDELDTVDTDGGMGPFILALDESGTPVAFKTLQTGSDGDAQVAVDGQGGVWMVGSFDYSVKGQYGEIITSGESGSFLARFELQVMPVD